MAVVTLEDITDEDVTDVANRLNQVEDILRSIVADFPDSLFEAVAESALNDLQQSHAAVQLLGILG